MYRVPWRHKRATLDYMQTMDRLYESHRTSNRCLCCLQKANLPHASRASSCMQRQAAAVLRRQHLPLQRCAHEVDQHTPASAQCACRWTSETTAASWQSQAAGCRSVRKLTAGCPGRGCRPRDRGAVCVHCTSVVSSCCCCEASGLRPPYFCPSGAGRKISLSAGWTSRTADRLTALVMLFFVIRAHVKCNMCPRSMQLCEIDRAGSFAGALQGIQGAILTADYFTGGGCRDVHD